MIFLTLLPTGSVLHQGVNQIQIYLHLIYIFPLGLVLWGIYTYLHKEGRGKEGGLSWKVAPEAGASQ